MGLRTRVYALLTGIVVATVALAWLHAGRTVLRPLVAQLGRERVAVAVMLAELAEHAPRRRRSIGRMADDLDLVVEVVDTLPELPQGWTTARDGHQVQFFQGPRAPVAVSFVRGEQEQWLLVTFGADLERPTQRVGRGLLLIALLGAVGGALVVRVAFRPLTAATAAMRRVADGELSHRVPENALVADVSGVFNTMASRVEGLVTGQRELMAAVSHELRTPLTRMRLQLELLRDTGADARRVDALEREIGAIDLLVGELVESARLQQGVLALDLSMIAGRSLVEDAVSDVDLGERPLTVEVSDTPFLGDRRRLLRCVVNLLSNVVRYTPADAPVVVTVAVSPDTTVLSVADGGPGVSAQDRARLFDPFFRVDGSRSKATGGLGLGLMLVRQLAEAHGGRAEARASALGGLEVRLVLPTQGGELA